MKLLATIGVMLVVGYVLYRKLTTIEEKVDFVMSQAEDLATVLDEVADELDTIATGVTEIGTDTDTLLQEIQDLQNATPPEVDLSALIAKAQSLKSKVDSLGTSVQGVNDKVAAAPTPTPEPAPTDDTADDTDDGDDSEG